MDNKLRGLQGKSLFVYLDDIVVYANSIEEHDRKIKELFDRLRKAKLKLQPDKCGFLKRRVSYLGHVLSEDGLSVDPNKISCIKNFPTPINVKNIRQFLGLSGYYRRFIEGYAKLAKPPLCTALLQKDVVFEWTEGAEGAFQALKDALCSAPVLQFPNLCLPYNITTDASGFALGGILSQGPIGKDRPIAYTSRVERGPELNYEIYEKESLAVLYAVEKFRSYVYGRKITIVTDCEALTWFKTATLNSRVQKWRFKLSEYDYEILYKPGKKNTKADALSRNHPDNSVKINATARAPKRREAAEAPSQPPAEIDHCTTTPRSECNSTTAKTNPVPEVNKEEEINLETVPELKPPPEPRCSRFSFSII